MLDVVKLAIFLERQRCKSSVSIRHYTSRIPDMYGLLHETGLHLKNTCATRWYISIYIYISVVCVFPAEKCAWLCAFWIISVRTTTSSRIGSLKVMLFSMWKTWYVSFFPKLRTACGLSSSSDELMSQNIYFRPGAMLNLVVESCILWICQT